MQFRNRRFANTLLDILDKPVVEISEKDLLYVKKLDLTEYRFDIDDLDILCQCRNLEELAIEISNVSLDFLKNFPRLRDLELTYLSSKHKVDFSMFAELKHLEGLCVSGGDLSDIDYCNMESLSKLVNLRELVLHEFGTVDLKFLESMQWLQEFYCGYADKVYNVEAIGYLTNLSSLVLDGIEMNNLNFLKSLPTSMSLELCADEVSEGIESDTITRFKKYDVCEMTVDHLPDPKWWKG